MKLPMPKLAAPKFPARFPDFPPALSGLLSRLPAWPPSLAFAAACNRTAWPTLRELDWTPVLGRRFRIHVRDLGLSVFLSVRGDGFHAENSGAVEVTFTASARDFSALALRREDPDTLFFNRRLLIEGDTDLGLTLKNLLDAVDWDELAARMPLGLGRVARVIKARADAADAPAAH